LNAVPVTLRAQAILELQRRGESVESSDKDYYPAQLPTPHDQQALFIDSPAKRKVIRAGRRGGKTVGVAILAVREFQKGKRVLYAAPTSEQIARFWTSVTRALAVPIDAGQLRKNETEHLIEVQGTEQRIRAKTAWNADTLRGDYADLLILDEWQLMNEDAWGVVGAPMLLDNNGNAVFIYTPPSLHSRSVTKADDPQHAAKLFKKAESDQSGRWQTFHFKSRDNPHISEEALAELVGDMSALAYRMEIEAEDVGEAPGALWTHALIDDSRVNNGTIKLPDFFERVAVAIDPSASSTGDEAGIVGGGKRNNHFYPLEDVSVQGSPKTWATAAVTLYRKLKADHIVAEANNGGEMVEEVIHQIDPDVRVILVHASRGKQTRAEPVAAIYEQGRAHHAGTFTAMEDEMCLWTPGDASPNRMDALVWLATDLMISNLQSLTATVSKYV
jgi:hypothetical protein